MYSKNGKSLSKNQLEHILYITPLNFSSLSSPFIQQLTEQIKQLYVETYDYIAALNNTPEKINFQTVVQALIDLDLFTSKAAALCTYPDKIHPDESIRAICVEANKQINELSISCNQREDVFQVFRFYEEQVYQHEKAKLDPEQRRYFEDLMRAYRRDGLYSPDGRVKQRISEIKQQIAKLSIEFEQHVDEENTSFLIPASDLAGLPETWFTKEREHAPGIYKVTLKYPDLFPIMDYATNREIRKKIFDAFNARCESENLVILKNILILRNELVQLLQYKNFGDYTTEVGMAKKGEMVTHFLNDLNTRFTPLLEDNLKALTVFARTKEKDNTFELQIHDMRYYMRLREEALFSINMEEIKQYFPLNTLIQGTFNIYEKLLGLKFIARENDAIWHPDVQYFDVYDFDYVTDSLGEYRGGFYLDLYPREGKYAHAAAFPLQAPCDISHLENGAEKKQKAVSAMVCNFPKNENISFDNVGTFFHEFGHIMHFTCSDTRLSAHHANHTETDFLEAPSQMLENWCYQPAALNLLSAHEQTKEPLPAEIALQLIKKNKLHAGYIYKRQLVFAIFDFAIHSMSAEELVALDIKKYFNQLQSEILQLPSADSAFPANFEHLVGGYQAGYYGYLMSETYAADMFASAFEQDPLSPMNGARYRQFILKPGASLDGMDLLKNFLGREPKMDAFIKKNGLETNCTANKKRPAGIVFFAEEQKEPAMPGVYVAQEELSFK